MDLNNKKVAILGVGFMGGSLALAIKKRYPQSFVWGYTRSVTSLKKIKKSGTVDTISISLEEVVKNASLIVLASPVQTIIDTFRRISPLVTSKMIIIDMGSTKQSIENAAKKFLPDKVSFVGCHPLCGSEKQGVDFAKADLYQGAVCVITSRNRKTRQVVQFWKALGCHVIQVDARYHDLVIGYTSHLPHILAFSYVNIISQEYRNYTSGSFKDISRIAAASASVWVDIFLTNRKVLARGISHYIRQLQSVHHYMQSGKHDELRRFIEKANKKMEKLQ